MAKYVFGVDVGGTTVKMGLAVVMSDGMGGTKRMYVGRQFAGAHFADVMGNAKYDIKIDDEGCGEFYVNRRGLSVWIKKDCKL